MTRFRNVTIAGTGEKIVVPFTSEEEAEADALEQGSRRQALKDRVKAIGDGILTAGFPHDFGDGVQHLQLRNNTDRTNWLTSQAAYQAQVGAGQGGVAGAHFRTAENNVVTMTFLDGYMLLLSMAAWGAALYAVSWAKQDAIDAATTEAELDAIEADLEVGWT